MRLDSLGYISATRGKFLRFTLVSGAGWACDSVVFLVLSKVLAVTPELSNFASSYVGLTFVYWISLRIVFRKIEDGKKRFLFTYWGFQFFSILLYSLAIGRMSRSLELFGQTDLIPQFAGFAAKILVTPANLITNFCFMRFLSRFMKDAQENSTGTAVNRVNHTSIVI